MSELKLTAPVYKVLDTQTFDSGFSKRTLVLKTTGDYPQTIPFEFFKDKTALLDNLEEGRVVTVYYNLQGSEYKGKFYTNLNGWKIDAEQDGNSVIANEARKQAQPIIDEPDDSSGLPF